MKQLACHINDIFGAFSAGQGRARTARAACRRATLPNRGGEARQKVLLRVD
jgi:hypothetical protein